MSFPEGASSLSPQSEELTVPSAVPPTRTSKISIDLSVLTEVECEFLSESVDEKVKDLPFRYCTGCWSRL